jgi:adenine deaminase
MIPRTDPTFIAVARGDAPADAVVESGQIVDVFARRLRAATVVIHGGRIAAVLEPSIDVKALHRIDASGLVVMPGLIDAHMHIESTMLPPSMCAQMMLPHGTAGIVADPHEIANVSGVAGIRWMMEDARRADMNIWFTAPSCVPASGLETGNASLSAKDLEPLFADSRVIALAELMNFPGTIAGSADLLAKSALGLSRRGRVDGHAPALSGQRLQAYIAAGPSSDHECFRAAEAIEKLESGQRVFIREGSAERNLRDLLPAVTPSNAHRFCFCTDDVHACHGFEDGHLDRIIRRAAQLGFDGPTAVAMASLHVAEHYGLRDWGAIAAGLAADIALVRLGHDGWSSMKVERMFIAGLEVARDGACTNESPPPAVPPFLQSTVRLPASLSPAMFAQHADPSKPARVVGVVPGQIVTDLLQELPRVLEGQLCADPSRDLLLLASIERHGGLGSIGRGLVRGFGMRQGAIASTVGHDAHNLSVAGVDPADMLLAARRLEELGGGQCVAEGGRILAELPLPIAGLLSDRSVAEVARAQHAIDAAYRSLGGTLADPFMQLSFLPLSVIPHLKVSDRGIIDVDAFAVVPLQDGVNA